MLSASWPKLSFYGTLAVYPIAVDHGFLSDTVLCMHYGRVTESVQH